MQINEGILEWLLDGDISIQYQVHRDLLAEERSDLQERIVEIVDLNECAHRIEWNGLGISIIAKGLNDIDLTWHRPTNLN